MHLPSMDLGYDPKRNCGCMVATLIVAPFAALWLVGNVLGGFGCEGAPQPCTGDSGRFWLGIAVLAVTTLALAWLLNAALRWFKGRQG